MFRKLLTTRPFFVGKSNTLFGSIFCRRDADNFYNCPNGGERFREVPLGESDVVVIDGVGVVTDEYVSAFPDHGLQGVGQFSRSVVIPSSFFSRLFWKP